MPEEAIEETLAQLLAPKPAQVPVPQQRQQHLLLEQRFGRRRQPDLPPRRQFEEGARVRYVRQVEQLEEPIDRITRCKPRKLRVVNREPRPQFPGQPDHFRTIGRGLLRHHDPDALGLPEDPGEAVLHPSGPAHHRFVSLAGRRTRARVRQRGVGSVEPARQADAARNRVQFRDRKPVLSQQQVRPDHAWELAPERRMSLQRDQLRGLAAVQPVRHPGRLFALDAPAVQQVHRPIELVQHPSEHLDLPSERRLKRERLQGHSPLEPGKQPADRQCAPKVLRHRLRSIRTFRDGAHRPS
ncbi:MAG: hypothetical protein M5U12_24350 [Verrucomicrobia bacterium]|nr:hypothetical protein [Verrucomicrobiota bacterium]